MFKASVRLAEIMQEQGWDKKDLADAIGKSLSMVGHYLKRDKFTNAVLQSLFPLRKYGYNIPDYFTDEDAPMKIPNKLPEADVEAALKQLLEVSAQILAEQKKNSDLSEKLILLLKSRK